MFWWYSLYLCSPKEQLHCICINSCRFVYSDVCPSDHILSRASPKLQKVSTRNFVGRYISLGRSTVHKKHNSALPNFGVIVLCSFFYTLNIVPNLTLKLHKIPTRNLVCNFISLSRSAMHKHRNSVCQFCFLLPFVYFLTLSGKLLWNYLRYIQELLYLDWSHWVEMQCTRTELCLCYFGVIALCSFYIQMLSVFEI